MNLKFISSSEKNGKKRGWKRKRNGKERGSSQTSIIYISFKFYIYRGDQDKLVNQ